MPFWVFVLSQIFRQRTDYTKSSKYHNNDKVKWFEIFFFLLGWNDLRSFCAVMLNSILVLEGKKNFYYFTTEYLTFFIKNKINFDPKFYTIIQSCLTILAKVLHSFIQSYTIIYETFKIVNMRVNHFYCAVIHDWISV